MRAAAYAKALRFPTRSASSTSIRSTTLGPIADRGEGGLGESTVIGRNSPLIAELGHLGLIDGAKGAMPAHGRKAALEGFRNR